MTIPAYIFSGIAGLRKERRLQHLRRYILTERLKLLNAEDPDFAPKAEGLIPIVELIHITQNELTHELYKLFDAYRRGLEQFKKRMLSISAQNPPPRFVFIHTHLTNFVTGHFRSWVGMAGTPTLFANLEIEMIINLIDNIHVCRSVIHSRGGFPLTLDQIITWRDAEQMVSEILAGHLPNPESGLDDSGFVLRKSKVIATDHCVRTVADLLLEHKPQIYTAYPISKIRDIDYLIKIFGNNIAELPGEAGILERVQGEIDDKRAYADLATSLSKGFRTFSEARQELATQNLEFRSFFSNKCIAYDPGTIDEGPLLSKAQNRHRGNIAITRKDSWPLLCEPSLRLAGEETLPEQPSVKIPVKEIRDLQVPTEEAGKPGIQSTIGRQVRSRDLRLIEQSDGTIAYRPTLGGRWSTGVKVEYEHCMMLNKPFFGILDTSDASPTRASMMEREPANDFGRWDLSQSSERQKAFQTAYDRIAHQIEEAARIRR